MIRLLYVLLLLLMASRSTGQTSMMPELSEPMLQHMIQLAQENYPRSKIFQQKERIAQLQWSRARTGWLDVVNVAYMRTDNLGATSKAAYLLNGYQYGLNLNLGSLFQKPVQIKIARIEADNSVLERQEYERNVVAQVKERYYTYAKQLTILKLRMKSAQDAENVLELVRGRFEKGTEKFEVYTEALDTYTTQVQEKVNAESALLSAKAGLEELVGATLEDLEYWKNSQVQK